MICSRSVLLAKNVEDMKGLPKDNIRRHMVCCRGIYKWCVVCLRMVLSRCLQMVCCVFATGVVAMSTNRQSEPKVPIGGRRQEGNIKNVDCLREVKLNIVDCLSLSECCHV